MLYGPDYNDVTNFTSTSSSISVWAIVILVIAIFGGVTLYYLFVNNDKDTKNKHLNKLKDFLSFKKLLIEDLLKIIYLVVTIFITLYSFELITESVLSFILLLVFGNLINRLIFEGVLINIMIWKNTTEINQKMKK